MQLRPTLSVLLFSATALFFAGCETAPNLGLKVTIAGGEEVKLLYAGPRPVMTKTEDVEVLTTQFIPAPPANLKYLFAFKELKGRQLKHVLVEDVTEDKAYTLIDDHQPKKNDAGSWGNASANYDLASDCFAWLKYESMSVRVYRFTIETVDGAKIVVLQHSDMIQPFMKANIRRSLEMQAEAVKEKAKAAAATAAAATN